MASETAAITVDAHHHLWRYTPADFGWINDAMHVIRRDFLPEDLLLALAESNVQATVAVQARQSLEETRWLLELAGKSDVIRGVVGWAPLTSSDVSRILSGLSNEPKLKGLRHVIQDEPDDNYILRDDFNRGINAMADTGLVFDILIYAKHLPQATAFVDRHPKQTFVLDHIAKPPIKLGEAGLEPWATNIRELARRPNVHCKLSGIVTEADWQTWSLETLRPYLDVVLESFGPARLMMGSDWPVCLVATSYKRWIETSHIYISALSKDEQAAIFGANAVSVYRL
jgi:L-fuconolactonase